MTDASRIAELERRVAALEMAARRTSDSLDSAASPQVAPQHGDVVRLAREYLAAYPVATEQDFAAQCFISEWHRMRDKQAFVDAVWAGLARWRASSKWRDEEGELATKYIPSPARFLGFERNGRAGSRMYMDDPPAATGKRVSVVAVNPAEIERQRREVTPDAAARANAATLARFRAELASPQCTPEDRGWIYREFPELRREATA